MTIDPTASVKIHSIFITGMPIRVLFACAFFGSARFIADMTENLFDGQQSKDKDSKCLASQSELRKATQLLPFNEWSDLHYLLLKTLSRPKKSRFPGLMSAATWCTMDKASRHVVPKPLFLSTLVASIQLCIKSSFIQKTHGNFQDSYDSKKCFENSNGPTVQELKAESKGRGMKRAVFFKWRRRILRRDQHQQRGGGSQVRRHTYKSWGDHRRHHHYVVEA